VRKFLTLGLVFLFVLSCQPSTNHPYQGKIVDSAYLIAQIAHPERFFQQVYDLVQYCEPELKSEDADWKKNLSAFFPSEASAIISNFLESIDFSQPIMFVASDESKPFGESLQVIFSVKSNVPAMLIPIMEELNFTYKQHQNIIILSNFPNALEPKAAFDLNQLQLSVDPSVEIYVKNNKALLTEDALSSVNSFKAFRSMILLEPEPKIQARWDLEEDSELASDFQKSVSQQQDLNVIMDKLPKDGLLGWAARLNYDAISEENIIAFFQALGVSEDILQVVSEHDLYKLLPEGFSFYLKNSDNTPLDFDDSSKLELEFYLVKTASVEGVFQLLQIIFSKLQESPSDVVFQANNFRSRTEKKHGLDFTIWEMKPEPISPNDRMVVAEVKSGDFFVSGITNLPFDRISPNFKNITQTRDYPFSKETDFALWFNTDAMAQIAPPVPIDEGPLGKTWLLASYHESSMEFNFISNKQTLKYFYQLGKATSFGKIFKEPISEY